MKDETRTWLSYADENLEVAELSFKHGHLNACLQNAQQSVEKYLKAVIVDRDLEFRRTHSIRELVGILADQEIVLDVSEDEMDLMDSIYVSSKYPVYSALP
jgi:HEPN domain-containing protein